MPTLSASPSITNAVFALIASHDNVSINAPRNELIDCVSELKQAILTPSGALSAWHGPDSTGRIPKDTYIVRDNETETTVDWQSPACNTMKSALFEMLLNDAVSALGTSERLFVLDRTAGHDPDFALPVKIVTDSALVTLFADNMFCAANAEIAGSVFASQPFTLVVAPDHIVDDAAYKGLLREENGKTVGQVIAMDFTKGIGVICGTRYLGAVKKTIFTVMNYLLPKQGVLPLHCSANEATDRSSAIFLGLSGTGKTTLSNDPERILIGDDEHGWNDEGIFNLEAGCYAKLIQLRQEKEPDVFQAVFGKKPVHNNGCIIENAMTYPDGTVDVDDTRLTENSRASYPLTFLKNTRSTAMTSHPKTVIFLTADAQGVLPPVGVLSTAQAQLWFLMGYTSKLGGTEKGIFKPVSAFSRFFGAPFMPALPSRYLELFAEKIAMFQSNVFLINTGWTGGPYGTGKRFDIDVTRRLVQSALGGSLSKATLRTDARWKLSVPTHVEGIDDAILNPASTWNNASDYAAAADSLAREFATAFEKSFAGLVSEDIANACPGR